MADRDIEYQKLACKILGLVHPDDRGTFDGILLQLGQFRIIDSEAAAQKVIGRYLWKLRDITQEVLDEKRGRAALRLDGVGKQHQEMLSKISKKAVLLPADFYRLNGRGDTEEKRETFTQGRAFVKDTARQELARLQRFTSFSSDFAGYCQYLDRACPDLFFRLSKDIPVLVPEENHTTHTYIMSTTKTGKSELLKSFVLNYVQRPDYASVLVLDPGGDMSRQIAQWPELIPQGRLIYIDPAMSDTHVPVINPFDVKDLTRREKGKLTGQIVAVIGSLVEGKMGGDISTSMEAVLYPSVRLLIDLPNTSLADLPKIMIDDPRLVALGAQSPDPDVADFFQNHFGNVNELTKKSITQKVNSILNKGELRSVLCGRNSIDLRHALNNKMVVIANLAKGALDFEESRVIGMILVAMAQSIGMERVNTPENARPQTHLIIDECQNFVTGELKGIIRETRKFGLSVMLAQQEVGGEMTRDLRNVVVKTTNVKIAGRSDMTETVETGKLVGVDAGAIAQCEAGQFYYRAANNPPFKLRARSDRLKLKGCMNLATWEKIKAQQIKRYYRPIRNGDDGPRVAPDQTPPPTSPPGASTFDFE
jgi:hypothetical protein